ncbi:MAG: hypothetical protein Q3993_03635, partial [Filifactor alocis]|nr:hypothetical protein [Filifactor alocis]
MARQSKLNKRNVKKNEVKYTEEVREVSSDLSETTSEVKSVERLNDVESVEQKESFFIGDTFLDNSSISKEIKEELKKYEEKVKEVEGDYRRDDKEVEKATEKEVKVREEKTVLVPPVYEELPSLNNTALEKKEVPVQEKRAKRASEKPQRKENPVQQPKTPRPRHNAPPGRPTLLFRTLLFVVPVLLMMAVGGYYIHKLSKAPALSEQNIETGNNTKEGLVYQYGPLHPFEMCSMRKPDLIAQLGEPMGEGEGVDEETKYLRYEYEWFGLPTKSKIYYAREQRIYKAVINFHNIEFDELQTLITKG